MQCPHHLLEWLAFLSLWRNLGQALVYAAQQTHGTTMYGSCICTGCILESKVSESRTRNFGQGQKSAKFTGIFLHKFMLAMAAVCGQLRVLCVGLLALGIDGRVWIPSISAECQRCCCPHTRFTCSDVDALGRLRD